MSEKRKVPAGCTIKDIRRGTNGREHIVYASLYGPSGGLIISGTLSYICEALLDADIGAQSETAPEPTP